MVNIWAKMHFFVFSWAEWKSRNSKTLGSRGNLRLVIYCITCKLSSQNFNIAGHSHDICRYPAWGALQRQQQPSPDLKKCILTGVRYHIWHNLNLFSWIATLYEKDRLCCINVNHSFTGMETPRSFSQRVLALSLLGVVRSSVAYNLDNKCLVSHVDNKRSVC